MKKKLLLTLAISIMLLCLFAIGISASTPNAEGETFTLSDGTPLPIWDTDGNGLIWYTSTNNADDGYAGYDYVSNNQRDTSVYPYVEVNIWSGGVSGSTGTGYQLSYFKVWDMVGETKTEVAYSRGSNVVLANIQGMKYNDTTLFNCFNSTFKDGSNVEAVWLDEGTKYLISHTFNNCASLRYTNVGDTALIYCGGQANFAECKVLTEIKLPATVTSVGEWQFQTTAIKEFTIPESVVTWGATNFKQCYYLEDVYGYEALIKRLIENSETKTTTILSNTFVDCYELNMPFTNGVIPEGVTAIGGYAFDDCKNGDGWSQIILPNTLTNIGQNAFQNCDGINKVVLGASFTTWDSYDGFKNCNNLNEVYMPATMTTIAGNVFNVSASNCIFYFTGTESQLDAIQASSNSNNTAFHTAYKNAVDYLTYSANPSNYASGKYIVYDYNLCKAFYGDVHDITSKEGNTCSGSCSRCELFEMLENPVHTEEIKLVFGTGVYLDGVEETTENVDYYANMYVLHVCKYCEEATADKEAPGAMFVKMGFSASETDTSSISFQVAVNHTALEKYEEAADTTVEYGLLVSATPTANPITGVTGGELELAANTVKIEMTGKAYTRFSVKVTGLPQDQTLNCCGYAVNGENVTYLNHATADAEAATVSHTIALELQSTTEAPEADGEGTAEETPVE